jgi:hypothetical protein
MTKYFKLLGIALLATSLAFVSCGDEGDDTTDPGTNPPTEDPQPDPEPEPGTFTVTFGSDSYTPAVQVAAYTAAEGYYGLISLKNEPQAQEEMYVDRVNFYSTSATVGTATGALNSSWTWGEQILQCEYFLVFDDLVTFDGQTLHGDYWARTVTENITAIDLTAMTISATINAEMISIWDGVDAEGYFDEAAAAAAQATNMTVAVGAVQMEDMDAAKKSMRLGFEVEGPAKKAVVR